GPVTVGVAIGDNGARRLCEREQRLRGVIPCATRWRHSAQPFAGQSGFTQCIEITLSTLGYERLVIAFTQQRNTLMTFCNQPACGVIRPGVVVKIKPGVRDRKSTRLNSSHVKISYAVFC